MSFWSKDDATDRNDAEIALFNDVCAESGDLEFKLKLTSRLVEIERRLTVVERMLAGGAQAEAPLPAAESPKVLTFDKFRREQKRIRD